jgi:hypothetical protein
MSLTDGMRGRGSVDRRSHGGPPLAGRGRPGVGGVNVVCGVASLRCGVMIAGAWVGIGRSRGYLAVAVRVRRGHFKE